MSSARSWASGAKHGRATAMVKETYGMVCHLCSKEIVSDADFSVDHVIPRSKGGDDGIENLRPSHRSCNYSRGNRSIEQFRASRTDATRWYFELAA